MTIVLEITDPTRLDEVAGCIHDCWFSLDDVTLDHASSVLTVPYRRAEYVARTGRLPGRRRQHFRWLLHLGFVRTYSITDTEHIGSYDFNELRFDSERGLITVDTNVPLGFEIEVDGFLIIVESTDEPVS